MITLEMRDNSAGFKFNYVFDLERKRWIKVTEVRRKYINREEKEELEYYDVSNAMVLSKKYSVLNDEFSFEVQVYIDGQLVYSKYISPEEFVKLMDGVELALNYVVGNKV